MRTDVYSSSVCRPLHSRESIYYHLLAAEHVLKCRELVIFHRTAVHVCHSTLVVLAPTETCTASKSMSTHTALELTHYSTLPSLSTKHQHLRMNVPQGLASSWTHILVSLFCYPCCSVYIMFLMRNRTIVATIAPFLNNLRLFACFMKTTDQKWSALINKQATDKNYILANIIDIKDAGHSCGHRTQPCRLLHIYIQRFGDYKGCPIHQNMSPTYL